jgi:hypothetical protein
MRGWEVELKDGTILKEHRCAWRKVPKKQIKRLTLHFDGRRWDLMGKEAYFVRTSASMVPGINESFLIEKRAIGYYEGASKVVYQIDERTGHFTIHVH